MPSLISRWMSVGVARELLVSSLKNSVVTQLGQGQVGEALAQGPICAECTGDGGGAEGVPPPSSHHGYLETS